MRQDPQNCWGSTWNPKLEGILSDMRVEEFMKMQVVFNVFAPCVWHTRSLGVGRHYFDSSRCLKTD